MDSSAIFLRFAPAGRAVALRELTGHDERRVRGIATRDALELIDAVLAPARKEKPPVASADLVAADRDRILAELYRRAFGDRIQATLLCEGCGEPFDIEFSLQDLAAATDNESGPRKYASVGANLFEAPAGWRFRIPTGRDECEVAAFDPTAAEKALFELCVEESATPPDMAELETALEELAPLIEFDLKASCPGCQQVQLVQFDIQTYLLRSLLNEQSRQAFEIHRLAAAYHWSLDEVLSLTRHERRRLVEMVEHDISRRAIPS